MLLLVQLALFVAGVVLLFVGRLPLSRTKVVEGAPARVLGLVAAAPLPVAFTVGFFVGFLAQPADPQKFLADNRWNILLVDAGLVLGAVLIVVVGALVFGTDPTEGDDYDRPRRRRRRRQRYEDIDDAGGEYDRPRSRPAYEVVDDEYDEPARPRRRVRDDGDDYDDRPRRRYRDGGEDGY